MCKFIPLSLGERVRSSSLWISLFDQVVFRAIQEIDGIKLGSVVIGIKIYALFLNQFKTETMNCTATRKGINLLSPLNKTA